MTLPTPTIDGDLCEHDTPIVREIFNRIGDKWTLLVIRMLAVGPQRFTALRSLVPASRSACSPSPCASSSATASFHAPCTPRPRPASSTR